MLTLASNVKWLWSSLSLRHIITRKEETSQCMDLGEDVKRVVGLSDQKKNIGNSEFVEPLQTPLQQSYQQFRWGGCS